MSEFREEIRTTLLKNRPKLTEKSLSAYVSTLYNLPKKISTNIDYSKLKVKYYRDNIAGIMDYLENIPVQKRKSILSAIFILVDVKVYQTLMNSDIEQSKAYYQKQELSKSQEENWINWPDVLAVHERLGAIAYKAMKKKNITKTDKQLIKKYVLLSCFVMIDPRRSTDYSYMKLRDYDVDTDNYYNGIEFVFNKYKTHSTYGRIVLKLPPVLCELLDRWFEINEHDFLIPTMKGSKISESGITKIFNDIFDKKISVNILRHSYLTDLYKNVPSVASMHEKARAMGHSLEQSLEYVKKV